MSDEQKIKEALERYKADEYPSGLGESEHYDSRGLNQYKADMKILADAYLALAERDEREITFDWLRSLNVFDEGDDTNEVPYLELEDDIGQLLLWDEINGFYIYGQPIDEDRQPKTCGDVIKLLQAFQIALPHTKESDL